MKSRVLFAKLDPGFYSNRKVRRAGLLGAAVYTYALCQNAGRGGFGLIPSGDLEIEHLADMLRVSEEDANRGVTAAVTAGLLEIQDETVAIVGWDDDWARHRLSDAEKQRNYRERKAKATNYAVASYREPVTVVTEGNVLPIRGEERRGERENGVTPGTSLSLPSDFAPCEAAVSIAQKRRLDLPFELAKFRNHANDKAITSSDWNARFCNWLHGSRDVDRKPVRRKASAKPTAFVTRQIAPSGVQFVLTEANGDQRVITKEEADEFASRQATPSQEGTP